jgi:hypothetical protein
VHMTFGTANTEPSVRSLFRVVVAFSTLPEYEYCNS